MFIIGWGRPRRARTLHTLRHTTWSWAKSPAMLPGGGAEAPSSTPRRALRWPAARAFECGFRMLFSPEASALAGCRHGILTKWEYHHLILQYHSLLYGHVIDHAILYCFLHIVLHLICIVLYRIVCGLRNMGRSVRRRIVNAQLLP